MKKARHPGNKSPTPMDRVIGRRIRTAREAAGLGQVALAEAIGIAFQQI